VRVRELLNSKCVDLRIYDVPPNFSKYAYGPVKMGNDDLCRAAVYTFTKKIPIEMTGLKCHDS